MQFIQRHKIITVIAIWALCNASAFAQANQEQFDNRRIRFGFSLTTNIPTMRIDNRMLVMQQDSIMRISTFGYPGIGLGGITNLRLGEFWDLRLLFPVISFVQRNIVYEMANNTKKDVRVESAYADISLLTKFKSARRKNVRAYLVGGFRVSYDLSSTINTNRSLESPIVSLQQVTTGYEAGFGLDFYFAFFKFSPEIKVMNTFGNAVYYDGFIYTDVIDKLSPKMVVISLHFE